MPGHLKPTRRWRHLTASRARKSVIGRRLRFACSCAGPCSAACRPCARRAVAATPASFSGSSSRMRSSRIRRLSPSRCPARVAARCRSSSSSTSRAARAAEAELAGRAGPSRCDRSSSGQQPRRARSAQRGSGAATMYRGGCRNCADGAAARAHELSAQGRPHRTALPPPRWQRGRLKPIVFGPDTEPPLFSPPTTLDEVRPLEMRAVVHSTREGRLWNEFVARYHYLGYKTLVGPRCATPPTTATAGPSPCSASPLPPGSSPRATTSSDGRPTSVRRTSRSWSTIRGS